MSTIKSRPRRWLAAATALICAAAAVVFAWPSSPASAADLLRQAVNATVAAGSASMSFDAVATNPSGSSASSGSGTVSFANNEAVFTLADTPSFPGGADLRITTDGVYLRAPKLIGTFIGPDKTWLAFPPLPTSQATATTTSTTTTTTTTTSSAPPTTAASILHAIEVLRTQGFEVVDAGPVSVNGVSADSYTFHDPTGAQSMSGTAYVDQESGALTRLEMNTADAPGTTGQLKLDMIKSAAPVDVPTPPAVDTVDIKTALAPKQ